MYDAMYPRSQTDETGVCNEKRGESRLGEKLISDRGENMRQLFKRREQTGVNFS